jgi:hypothetical protein
MDMFSRLERAVIEKFLEGDLPMLSLLRRQYIEATSVDREFTGVGFFTRIQIPPHVQRACSNPRIILDDVVGHISGLQNPVGFVLFILNGGLGTLEGYTHEEAWPDEVDGFTLRYRDVPRDLSTLVNLSAAP